VPPAPPPPPPPPPPPGINASGNELLPKMQLKRVNWEKLGIAGLENTVWGQVRIEVRPPWESTLGGGTNPTLVSMKTKSSCEDDL
jgi:hypothetical protein